MDTSERRKIKVYFHLVNYCYHWAVVVAQLVEIRIQSLAILFTTYQLFYKLYLKDENKEKEAGKGPNLNLLLSFD